MSVPFARSCSLVILLAATSVTDPSRRTAPSELRGLTIATVVEDLSAQSLACGLDQDKIKTSIAHILTGAGFKTERFGNEDAYMLLSVVTSRLATARASRGTTPRS